MKKQIYVVTIDTIKVWDPCQRSYLPTMCKVFGVYTSDAEAKNAVWSYFGNDKFDWGTDVMDENGNYLYYDDLFILTDKRYEGRAYYCVNYHVESIEI